MADSSGGIERERLRALLRAREEGFQAAERVRAAEASAFSFGDNWRLVDDLVRAGLEHPEERASSGLVEWQRAMMLWAEWQRRKGSR
ncbi:MAG: hypothetical protein SF028_11580 [Candidatus Sumerlaeia bacterium]|nr:hypothetical protein [Candidatus Sumerlaeia bacterium]